MSNGRRAPMQDRSVDETLIIPCPCCYGLGQIDGDRPAFEGEKFVGHGKPKAIARRLCNPCHRALFLGGSHPHPMVQP